MREASREPPSTVDPDDRPDEPLDFALGEKIGSARSRLPAVGIDPEVPWRFRNPSSAPDELRRDDRSVAKPEASSAPLAMSEAIAPAAPA
jgi:hypothetical protein